MSRAALPVPGAAWSREGRTVVALRPEVLAALERGEPDAQRVALHELAHAIFDQDVLAGEAPKDPERERRADLFAEAALWLLRRG